MQFEPQVKPLPRRKRQITFALFFVIFLASLPFLYLYATGYRFDFSKGNTNFISTGGMYIAAERTGADIYIDGVLVKETRVFRRAFYAQSLEPGTHRVYVQKEAHQTWVKELPVSAHLVTEAQAFNLPLVPSVRVISLWQSATGSAVVNSTLLNASTTNTIVATSTKLTSTFVRNPEYASLITLFSTSSTSTAQSLRNKAIHQVEKIFSATSTTATSTPTATTTKEWRDVRLAEEGSEVYARWIGDRENIPYYYCASEFPPYSTSTEPLPVPVPPPVTSELPNAETEALIHPIQTVPKDAQCDPVIKIDRKSQTVHSFDFYPGSIDLVLMSLDDGIYVVEVDNRAWQNVQPLIQGYNLEMRVLNGQIYVYDGKLIYQIILEAY